MTNHTEKRRQPPTQREKTFLQSFPFLLSFTFLILIPYATPLTSRIAIHQRNNSSRAVRTLLNPARICRGHVQTPR